MPIGHPIDSMAVANVQWSVKKLNTSGCCPSATACQAGGKLGLLARGNLIIFFVREGLLDSEATGAGCRVVAENWLRAAGSICLLAPGCCGEEGYSQGRRGRKYRRKCDQSTSAGRLHCAVGCWFSNVAGHFEHRRFRYRC